MPANSTPTPDRGLPDRDVPLAYQIRRLIMIGEFGPGDPMPQELIADRLGVSRMPVREALKSLEADGHVVGVANKGYYVTSHTPAQLSEIYTVRLLLEEEALKRALVLLDEWALYKMAVSIDEMDAADQRLRAGPSPEGLLSWIEANSRFHLELYEHANAPYLTGLVRRLWSHNDAYRSSVFKDQSERERAQSEHRRLLEACKDRDSEKALQISREHSRTMLHNAIVLVQSGDPTETDQVAIAYEPAKRP